VVAEQVESGHHVPKHCSMQTDFVLDAPEQALYARRPERKGSLVHHSDRFAVRFDPLQQAAG